MTICMTEYSNIVEKKRNIVEKKIPIFQVIYLKKYPWRFLPPFFSSSLYLCVGLLAIGSKLISSAGPEYLNPGKRN